MAEADAVTEAEGKLIVSDLVDLGAQYSDARHRTEEVRSHLDSAIRDAREARITYAEISESIGMSVAWVQASLKRSESAGIGS